MSDMNFNGIDDAQEYWPTNDANYNGVDDAYEITDTNFNGIDDAQEYWPTNDANYNGVDDAYEITDTNFNGIDDAQEYWPTNDANFNGVDDAYEITDTNFNGIDDAQEYWPTNDANLNGIDDAQEYWPTNDANFNGIDDAQEITDTNFNGIDDAQEYWPTNDANLNGIDDAQEITDTNFNGIDDAQEYWPTNDANLNGIDDAQEQTVAQVNVDWAPITSPTSPTGDLLSLIGALGDPATTSSQPFGADDFAPVWQTAPADDLGAALAYAQHLVTNPYDHPALAQYAGLQSTIDAIAGPQAIAAIVGVPYEPGMTLDDLALATALRGPLSAETGVPVEQFSLKSGTGLQLNPFFGNQAAGLTLNGLGDWVDDLVTSAKANGTWKPGAGGLNGFLEGQTNWNNVMNDVRRWDLLLWADNATSFALSPFPNG